MHDLQLSEIIQQNSRKASFSRTGAMSSVEKRAKKRMKNNPYPKTVVDDASGTEFLNERHRDWEQGYLACLNNLKESKRKGNLKTQK